MTARQYLLCLLYQGSLRWRPCNSRQVGWHTFIRQSDEGKVHYWVRYPDGGGFLAYPGKPVGVDGPVSTIRLEQVREGLEDFEAIRPRGGGISHRRCHAAGSPRHPSLHHPLPGATP